MIKKLFDKYIQTLFKWVGYAILVILVVAFFMLLLFLPGCKVIKGKKASSYDSTAVSKKVAASVDSSAAGSVSKATSKSMNEYDWYRITQQFGPQQGRDTNVTNFYNTYPQYPTTVIYEGGKGKSQEEKSSYDSSWMNNLRKDFALVYDSLTRRIQTLETSKESKPVGLGLFQILFVAAGAIGLNQLLSVLKARYKIVRRL